MKTNPLFFPLSLRFAVGALVAVFASSLFAQSPSPDVPVPPAKDGSAKYSDRNFLKKAAKAGDDEINISAVAASRSANAQVKELAQIIVTDHQNIAAQLANLAAAKGVELPAKEMVAAKWEKKSAKDFDRDYLKEMVDRHEDAVELFAKAAKSDDSQIAAFAGQQLPMLQSHLSHAKELLQTLE